MSAEVVAAVESLQFELEIAECAADIAALGSGPGTGFEVVHIDIEEPDSEAGVDWASRDAFLA